MTKFKYEYVFYMYEHITSMANNTIKKFSNLYKELVSQLKKTFPKLTKHLPDYSKYTPMDCINDFVIYNLPFMDDISVGNVDIFTFKYKKSNLINGLAFRRVLRRSPPLLVEAILRYMRDLYTIGHETKLLNIIANNIDDKFTEQRRSVLQNHDAILTNFQSFGRDIPEPESEEEESEPEPENMFDTILKGLGGGQGLAGLLSGGGGGLAGLAGLLSGESGGLAGLSGLTGLLSGGAGLAGGDPSALFGNSEIGKVVKDLYDEMGEDEMNTLNQQDPATMMTQLMGVLSGQGGENNVISNMIERTAKSVEQKIESGEINLQRMMTDVQGFLNVLDPNSQTTAEMPATTESSDMPTTAESSDIPTTTESAGSESKKDDEK